MKRAIVSGANGFVGNALVKELLDLDYQVVALVKKENRESLSDDERISFKEFELANAKNLMESIPIDDYDVFFHLAWSGSSGEARADVSLQLKNVEWTIDTLHIANKLGCRRFVCAGSIMEDEVLEGAYKQGNIYGIAKLTAHMMCMAVAAQVGIELIWAKITNAYGPGEVSPRMVNTTIRSCISGRSPSLTSGIQNYDFVYIDDVARAFRLIAEKGKPFQKYLIGSSNAKPLKEFMLEMQAAIAPDLEFIFGDVPFLGVSLPLENFICENTEKDTGFRAKVSFAEGVKRTMKWLKENDR